MIEEITALQAEKEECSTEATNQRCKRETADKELATLQTQLAASQEEVIKLSQGREAAEVPRVTAHTLATALEGVQEGPIASSGSPPPGTLVLAGPSVGRENSSVRPVSSVGASTTVHSGASIATGTASSVVPVNTTMS